MFIRNLWNRSGNDTTDLSKFDKITFEINPNENIPEISEEAKGPEHIQQLTPDHPLYNKIFKSQEVHSHYKKYTVKQGDSLTGISLKLNISEKAIKDINEFSGDTIFPGMTVNLPDSCDISLLEEAELVQPTLRPRISQLFQLADERKKTLKYDVYYCSTNCNIRGVLTLNPNYIMFNPSIEDEQNKKIVTTQKLLKYNAIIEIHDIKQVISLDIPEMSEDNDNPKIAHLVQLLLYRVGNKKLEQKYKERLAQLKIDKKAIASVSFRVIGETEEEMIATKANIKQKIQECLRRSEQAKKPQQSQEKGLTNITHFDILYANIIIKKDSLKLREDELNQRIKEISIKMTSDSMLPHEVFIQIAVHFPLIYQLHNWSLLYSCVKHGTSYNTLLRHCKSQDPLLLVIKEYKGRMFGAFMIQELEFGRTGRGEMFIWMYDHETGKVSVYKWTGKNEFFVFADSDGIAIGMGAKYGIYINSTLQKGFTSPTDTFGNSERLSVNQDFSVENLEVWSLEEQQY